MAAKELAVLDGLSDGRLIPGLAAGSSKAEFDAFGIPFSERSKRIDRTVPALRARADRMKSVKAHLVPDVRERVKPMQTANKAFQLQATSSRVANELDRYAMAYRLNIKYIGGQAQCPSATLHVL
ncbi:MAG: alkanesulfonate monooxygenase SsuD [Gammaproteobacteria bacterium]